MSFVLYGGEFVLSRAGFVGAVENGNSHSGRRREAAETVSI